MACHLRPPSTRRRGHAATPLRVFPAATVLAAIILALAPPTATAAAVGTDAGEQALATCQLNRSACALPSGRPSHQHDGRRPGPRHGVSSTALAFARSQLGKGYSLGGVGPRVYDCSGLVWRSYYQAGLNWRRGSAAALYQDGLTQTGGQRVSRSQTRPGDLLFWSENGRRSGIYHVAMYLGGDRVIEAANHRSGVRIAHIWRPRQLLPMALRLTG